MRHHPGRRIFSSARPIFQFYLLNKTFFSFYTAMPQYTPTEIQIGKSSLLIVLSTNATQNVAQHKETISFTELSMLQLFAHTEVTTIRP